MADKMQIDPVHDDAAPLVSGWSPECDICDFGSVRLISALIVIRSNTAIGATIPDLDVIHICDGKQRNHSVTWFPSDDL